MLVIRVSLPLSLLFLGVESGSEGVLSRRSCGLWDAGIYIGRPGQRPGAQLPCTPRAMRGPGMVLGWREEPRGDPLVP